MVECALLNLLIDIGESIVESIVVAILLLGVSVISLNFLLLTELSLISRDCTLSRAETRLIGNRLVLLSAVFAGV